MIIRIPYNRQYAVEYAKKWALSRNPLFVDFTGGGGNCTNFVSQSLFAGSGIMDFTPTFGWYYRSVDERAPAWSGVEQLYDFLTGSGDFAGRESEGPFAIEARNRQQVELGDVVQLANAEGDFYHTLLITGFNGNEILVSANSDNALDRPLSSYPFASLRVLHIMGVSLDVPLEESAEAIYNAEGIFAVMTGLDDVTAL